MSKYKFDCGCEIDIIDDTIKGGDGLPSLDLDYNNLREDCPATWLSICDGDTRGVFQLETQLGRAWAKKARPINIDEMSALISIIRPGCLQAVVDEKNMSQHYVDRKAGIDEVKYFHDKLEGILENTYGVLVYQEQSMKIATELAGFNLQEADSLRKAIGKKDMELMSKVEKEFLKKASEVKIIGDEDAKEIFDWIRKSQRYAFNKCLSPKTIVTTPEGNKTLSEIVPGDKVLAPKNEVEDEFVNVVNKYDNGEKELYEIVTESGQKLLLTLDHKLLCEDGVLRPLIEIIENNYKIMCQDD